MGNLTARCLLLLVVAGCTLDASDLDTIDESKAVAQALSAAVSFEGGTVIDGSLPDTTAPAVTIQPLSETVIIAPGAQSIMALDVDNPDEADDPVAATLVRFANARSYVEVSATRRSGGAAPVDGAGDTAEPSATRVSIDNTFTVASTVCSGLCNKLFATEVTEVATLDSGAVGAASTRAIVLDCRQAGDSSACGAGRTDDVSADIVDTAGGSGRGSGETVDGSGGTQGGVDDVGGTAGVMPGPTGGAGSVAPPADPVSIPDALKLCGGVACQCGDGVDNDGDGFIDGADAECTGAYDDDEGDFGTALPGGNVDPSWADCFFDGNTGAGDDGCRYALDCQTGALAQDDPACVVSQECQDSCLPLTPNGCDCFGCCTVFHPGGIGDYLVVEGCNADDQGGCGGCVKSTGGCENPCGLCELCPGRSVDELDPACAGQPTCDDGPSCEQQSDCEPDTYCSYGCCIAIAVP